MGRLQGHAEEKKELEDDSGFIYYIHEEIRDYITQFNDTVNA